MQEQSAVNRFVVSSSLSGAAKKKASIKMGAFLFACLRQVPKTALETDEQLAIASCIRRRSSVRFTHYRGRVDCKDILIIWCQKIFHHARESVRGSQMKSESQYVVRFFIALSSIVYKQTSFFFCSL